MWVWRNLVLDLFGFGAQLVYDDTLCHGSILTHGQPIVTSRTFGKPADIFRFGSSHDYLLTKCGLGQAFKDMHGLIKLMEYVSRNSPPSDCHPVFPAHLHEGCVHHEIFQQSFQRGKLHGEKSSPLPNFFSVLETGA